MKPQPLTDIMGITVEMVYSGSVKVTRSAHQPVYVIALFEQQLCEIRAVLSGNTGNQSSMRIVRRPLYYLRATDGMGWIGYAAV